jgi:hypothetical protein
MHANMVSRTTVRALAQRRCASSTASRNAMRTYATQTSLGTSPTSSSTRRKPVTPFNDTGRVPWGELSGAERVARTTQQSFNFGMIILGTVLTVGFSKLPPTEHLANSYIGRRSILPLHRGLRLRLQNKLVQPRRRPGKSRP